jgi:hypothetical protein
MHYNQKKTMEVIKAHPEINSVFVYDCVDHELLMFRDKGFVWECHAIDGHPVDIDFENRIFLLSRRFKKGNPVRWFGLFSAKFGRNLCSERVLERAEPEFVDIWGNKHTATVRVVDRRKSIFMV